MAPEPPALAPARPKPGACIDGFTLGERINAGGCGYVFAATSPAGQDPGFPLVMKIAAVGAGEPSAGILGFEMELMIHPALAGPHVPRLVASGDLAAIPYLVMERIEGHGLAERIDGTARDPDEVARAGAAVADALQSLHAQGAVHHDLKPDNVILRPSGEAVLLDLGFAYHARYPDLLAEETRFASGSAPYVSPEQLQARRGDPRSDLYALGAMLYEAATGEPPFGVPLTLAGQRDRLWRIPVAPRARNPNVPAWLQEVILRCLETDPELRYQSAAHVAFDLRNPDQVALSARAERREGPGLLRQLRRWWRMQRGALSVPSTPRPHSARVIMVAVDTTHLDDPRQSSIRRAARQAMALATEHRIMCVSVIRDDLGTSLEVAGMPSGFHLAHLVRLRTWAEPLELPAQRQSLHVVQALDPAAALVGLARANHVDLIVLGAPGPEEKPLAWWRSVASGVTANAPCSVYVVRTPAA